MSKSLRAYLVVSGSIFGLITLAHLARIVVEGGLLAREPWFAVLTLLAAALTVWAWRSLKG